MDLEELLPLVTGNAAMKLPGLVFASAAQGTVNAFMTIRVGILTKKYLFSADGPIEMPQARKDSYKEAIDFLKKCELHKDVIAIAKKTAQGAKEAAAASVKKVFKKYKNLTAYLKRRDFCAFWQVRRSKILLYRISDLLTLLS